MASLTSGVFLKDTFERAVRTFVQALLAAVGAGAVTTAVTDINWGDAALIGLTAAVFSVGTSVLASGIGDNGTASVVPEVVAAPANTV